MSIDHRGKHVVVRRIRTFLLALCVAGAAACEPVTPRGSGGTDGSARWALGAAQPWLTAFAADAQLREILGSGIALDGRLGANTGAWSFVVYSASRGEILRVTVDSAGKASSTRGAAAAPGPGIARPLPDGWVDSIAVLEVVRPHLSYGATSVGIAVLNVADYGGEIAGQAAWGLSFDRGPNQIVLWNGKYAGVQSSLQAFAAP